MKKPNNEVSDASLTSPRRRRPLPYSLLFLASSLTVYILQLFPPTGIFLMFLLAFVWSVFLVNAGMIGIALEALFGSVSRLWLVVPVVFYGGYWTAAVLDRSTFKEVAASYEMANSKVTVDFDPSRQSLVFERDWPESFERANLVPSFELPVEYHADSYTFAPVGYRSNRVVDAAICRKAQDTRALLDARIHTSFAIGNPSLCVLSMLEPPDRPVVSVSHREDEIRVGTLPVRRITITISLPDGRTYELLAGSGAMLEWFPAPIAGCALNSGNPSWDCLREFSRERQALVSGQGSGDHLNEVVARALGLTQANAQLRRAADPSHILNVFSAIESGEDVTRFPEIESALDNPGAELSERATFMANRHPKALVPLAERLISALERNSALTGEALGKVKKTSLAFAGLIALLPEETFKGIGSRILALYEHAGDGHWLWEADTLSERIGDLGVAALPIISDPRAPRLIQALCRIGPAARAIAEPMLIKYLNQFNDPQKVGFLDSEIRIVAVAMRRIGISFPLTVVNHPALAAAISESSFVTPNSPADVC